MNYETFIATMDAVEAWLFSVEPTVENANLALDRIEALCASDPTAYVDNFARVLHEGRPKRPSRLEAAQDFFIANLEMLRGATYDAYPELSPGNADDIMRELDRHLGSYRGPSREQPFLEWAIRFAKKEAVRLRGFYHFQSTCRLYALAGIWRVLHGCTDLGISEGLTVPELEAEVWQKVWDELDSFLVPDQPARPSTRIYEFGYWQARAWKTAQLRNRDRSVQIDNYLRREDATARKELFRRRRCRSLDERDAKAPVFEDENVAAV